MFRIVRLLDDRSPAEASTIMARADVVLVTVAGFTQSYVFENRHGPVRCYVDGDDLFEFIRRQRRADRAARLAQARRRDPDDDAVDERAQC